MSQSTNENVLILAAYSRNQLCILERDVGRRRTRASTNRLPRPPDKLAFDQATLSN